MNIKVKGCLDCPCATHTVDLDQSFEWLDCDLSSMLNGHEHDSSIYDGELNVWGEDDSRIKTPDWCPLKSSNVTISLI